MNSVTTTTITTHTSTDSHVDVAGVDKSVSASSIDKEVRTTVTTEPRANMRI